MVFWAFFWSFAKKSVILATIFENGRFYLSPSATIANLRVNITNNLKLLI